MKIHFGTPLFRNEFERPRINQMQAVIQLLVHCTSRNFNLTSTKRSVVKFLILNITINTSTHLYFLWCVSSFFVVVIKSFIRNSAQKRKANCQAHTTLRKCMCIFFDVTQLYSYKKNHTSLNIILNHQIYQL